MTALLNLCHNSHANQDAVREAGAIPALVALLRSERAAGEARAAAQVVLESAAACLRNLAKDNRANQVGIGCGPCTMR